MSDATGRSKCRTLTGCQKNVRPAKPLWRLSERDQQDVGSAGVGTDAVSRPGEVEEGAAQLPPRVPVPDASGLTPRPGNPVKLKP